MAQNEQRGMQGSLALEEEGGRLSWCTQPGNGHNSNWKDRVGTPVTIVGTAMTMALGSIGDPWRKASSAVSYTHLRAHETPEHLVCRLLLEKKKQKHNQFHFTV
eukprot:TRINITY_DN33278_c0_g1_i1.p1 TRINITY_DN33278_c0_g1~~TRINITY_DN33278_c0_g1_i1.p1  ORF type:complete len:104 (+),score=11.97 TRINITY_DN33278_c0_g1_i1:56-367(+)